MNNINAQNAIDNFGIELPKLDVLIQSCGATSELAKYLTRYTLMKASGVIEYSVKTIIADIHNCSSSQIQSFIDNKVRNSSHNPSYENIINLLKDFDDSWAQLFKQKCNALNDWNRISSSLKSLCANRNYFAHGKTVTASFSDIKQYYLDSVIVVEQVDAVVK